MPVKTISGKDCVEKNPAVFANYGEKCLIVTGKSSAKACGALDDVVSVLNNSGIQYLVYDKITENPYVQTCHEVGTIARDFDADFIIGIGGGSPMDAAKAIAVFAANPAVAPLDIYNKKWANEALPVLLVGTTAGTGSEVSAVSVMTDAVSGRKKALTDPQCFAKVSFLDPKYTHAMPEAVTISTALDAFSHAVEGFLSPKCTEIADVFARKAIPMIWKHLELIDKGCCELTEQDREELYYASIFAGFVLCSVGTAFPHPFGYILTEDFDIPHGRACATFLPELLEVTLCNDNKRADELLKLIDRSCACFSSVVQNLAATKSVKMDSKEIEIYSKRWVGLKNFENVRGGYSVEEGIKLFEKLFLKK